MKLRELPDRYVNRGTMTIDEITAQIIELAGVKVDEAGFLEHLFLRISFYQDPNFLRRRQAFAKAEDAARLAKKAILALDKRDQVALRSALYNELCVWVDEADLLRTHVKKVWNRWPDCLLGAFSVFTGNSPFLNPTGERGRTKGSRVVLNWHAEELITSLWELADTHRGSLSVNRSPGQDGGTLIKALELLRPLLPEDLLPKVLPISTIEAMIGSRRRNRKTKFTRRHI
jgi:hypothetical protein